MKKYFRFSFIAVFSLAMIALVTTSSCKREASPVTPPDTSHSHDTTVVIGTAWTTGDRDSSTFVKTDSLNQPIDSTKAKHTAMVMSTNFSIGGQSPVIVIVDSSYSPAGGFIPPPDTAYWQQQTN